MKDRGPVIVCAVRTPITSCGGLLRGDLHKKLGELSWKRFVNGRTFLKKSLTTSIGGLSWFGVTNTVSQGLQH